MIVSTWIDGWNLRNCVRCSRENVSQRSRPWWTSHVWRRCQQLRLVGVVLLLLLLLLLFSRKSCLVEFVPKKDSGCAAVVIVLVAYVQSNSLQSVFNKKTYFNYIFDRCSATSSRRRKNWKWLLVSSSHLNIRTTSSDCLWCGSRSFLCSALNFDDDRVVVTFFLIRSILFFTLWLIVMSIWWRWYWWRRTLCDLLQWKKQNKQSWILMNDLEYIEPSRFEIDG